MRQQEIDRPAPHAESFAPTLPTQGRSRALGSTPGIEPHPAGFAGLAVPTFLPEIMPAVEIGWRLGRAYWGWGLATEAAQAVVAHARAELGLRRLVSIHVVGNDASARVMVKLGMTLERETVQPDTGRHVRVYAMDL